MISLRQLRARPGPALLLLVLLLGLAIWGLYAYFFPAAVPPPPVQVIKQ